MPTCKHHLLLEKWGRRIEIWNFAERLLRLRCGKMFGLQTSPPEEELCPRGEGARPADCYNYTANYKQDNVTGCWSSHCTEKLSDASNSTCLSDCQRNKTVMTHCEFPQNDCENIKVLDDCPNKDVLTATRDLTKPKSCYHPANQSVDVPSGCYFDEVKSTCEKCKRWSFEEKSCKSRNAAALVQECPINGRSLMHKKCFKKDIIKDDCGCDMAQCVVSFDQESVVFDPEDECPTGYTKISGVSLCLVKRIFAKNVLNLNRKTPSIVLLEKWRQTRTLTVAWCQCVNIHGSQLGNAPARPTLSTSIQTGFCAIAHLVRQPHGQPPQCQLRNPP